jgi:3-deoxy-manno-octulosonate cytidylyltransferase (CMP-KDO synthetase)
MSEVSTSFNDFERWDSMKVLALIPARYASTRLPGKPLVEIAGKAMIQHVYERVLASRSVDRVIVATDDDRIARYVSDFGGKAVMTASDHISGTDRIAAAAAEIGEAEIILNVQGDEPMVESTMLDALLDGLDQTDCDCATPVSRITTARELFDTNVVKVVLRKDFSPLYFSRSPIPCVRDREPEEWVGQYQFYRHIGIYAYRAEALRRFVESPPSPLERAEQLEQLRMLDLGMSMLCVETEYSGHAVDTPEDVMHVEMLMTRTSN